MLGIVIALLILWVFLSVLGFAIKGLIWLAIVGIGLFIVTSAIGWIRRKSIER